MKRDIDYVVDRFSDDVYRAALAVTGNTHEAEDITSETMIKYFTRQQELSFGDDEHLKAWLLRTAINLSKDLLRSAGRRLRADSDTNTGSEFSAPDAKIDVQNAINRLDKKYRIVLYLYYYQGYKTEEIAEILGTGKGTVTSRLKRARDKLKLSIVTRHKGAKIVAAAAAVALVMSGGIYMTRNIHDYEPNAGTAPPANSSVSGDTGTQQLCSSDFMKLAGTVLDSANSMVGTLDIIQNSPAYCDVVYNGNYDENIEGKEHSARYYVDLLEKTDSGLPSVDFLTEDNSYEPNSLVIDILSAIKLLDEDAFTKAVNCRIEAHIENNNCKISISDGDNSVSLKYGSGESFTENAKNIAQTLKNDLLDIYDDSSMKTPDNAIFSYSPTDYNYYSDIMNSNDVTEYVKSDYAQNGYITNESFNLLTLNIVNDSDIQFNMATDYFTVDMFTNRFTLYSYANDGSWAVYDSAPFSNTQTVEADPSATAQYIYEKAQELVTNYNTEGKKLHFDTVTSLDLAKELAMSNVPDIDRSDNITPELFAYGLWVETLPYDKASSAYDLSGLDFTIYFNKDKDGSAYNVTQVDITVEGDKVYSYTTDEHDSVETYDANDSTLS